MMNKTFVGFWSLVKCQKSRYWNANESWECWHMQKLYYYSIVIYFRSFYHTFTSRNKCNHLKQSLVCLSTASKSESFLRVVAVSSLATSINASVIKVTSFFSSDLVRGHYSFWKFLSRAIDWIWNICVSRQTLGNNRIDFQ